MLALFLISSPGVYEVEPQAEMITISRPTVRHCESLRGGMLATDATSVFISSLNILKLRKLLRRSNNLIVMHAKNTYPARG